ncbi:hypothetical protein HC031_03825 [Planosporangium thailandense]|uniref:Uncharacterized protein n=1 Tax=Planosporangium thailandense TaxID=765197 RepID=A0ABX0XSI0_9ACTN|nr:hypothetical protein [Planosporangium thailandense]NJC68857.1 hypothetical protein [Planosporangium thailandense]
MAGVRIAAAAAMVALAAFAAGPGLGTPSAYADEGSAAIPTVSFDGGSFLNLIVCRSVPSRAALTVPAQSRVMFANRLGQDAVLRVDGQPVAQVGPGEAVPLVIHRGPVSVSMAFPCGTPVMEQFLAASITVVTGVPDKTQDADPPRPTASAAPEVGQSVSAAPGSRGSGHTVPPPARQPAGITLAASAGPTAVERSLAPVAAPAVGTPSAPPVTSDAIAVEPLVRASDSSRDTSSTLLASIVAMFVVCVTITGIRSIISKRTIRTHCA